MLISWEGNSEINETGREKGLWHFLYIMCAYFFLNCKFENHHSGYLLIMEQTTQRTGPTSCHPPSIAVSVFSSSHAISHSNDWQRAWNKQPPPMVFWTKSMPGILQRKAERSIGFISSQGFWYSSLGGGGHGEQKCKESPDYLPRHLRTFNDVVLAWEITHWVMVGIVINAFYVLW